MVSANSAIDCTVALFATCGTVPSPMGRKRAWAHKIGVHCIYAGPFVGVFQKSILYRFVIFWRLFPSKWLQNRPQIPKPSPGIPPHRAFCGYEPSVATVFLPRKGSPTVLNFGEHKYTEIQGYLAHKKQPTSLGPP